MILTVSPQTEVFNTYKSQLDSTANIGTANNADASVQLSDVKEFLALATLGNAMSVILNGQSLMNSNGSLIPALAVPPQLGEKISAEQSQSIVAMSANVNASDTQVLELVASSASNVLDSNLDQLHKNAEVATQVAAPLQEGDANKLERMAATAATLFTLAAASAVTNKAGEVTKSATESTPTTAVSSATPARSQAAVEGGTDITAATATSYVFTKIMGDPRIIELNNTLVRVLNEAENEQNRSAALASNRAMNSAVASGNHMIDSAKQNLTGAITSGVMGMGMQGATTVANVRALNKEHASVNLNLKNANRLDAGRMQNQSALKASSDKMLHNNQQLDRNVEGLIDKPHVDSQINASNMRDDHSIQQMKTMKIRNMTDLANQANHSAQAMVQNSYGVNAAEESKQAEIARADQTVNNEVANTHQQTAKKAADTQAAMQRVLENTLSNNNSAASSVAERMR